jgi:iron complex outermembrane receptor protein
MNNLKQILLGGSAIAVVAAGAFSTAYAQDATSIDTVEVSASRINLQGFAQPTPVTVIGLTQIQQDAKIDVGDEIRNLPTVSGTSVNTGSNSRCISQGDAGVDTVSLRNLGAQRNLVLFDRQRVPETDTTTGTVDLGILPSGVISRVDVVTGGASAAWGSDAVTGVINLVINKTFEGFKGSASYSNNTQIADGTNPTYEADMTWGHGFFDDRLHTLFSANMTIHNATVFPGQLPLNGRALGYNPAYCSHVTYVGAATTGGTCTSLTGAPMEINRDGTAPNNITDGGLVNLNTAGTTGSGLAANSLKGLMFVGPSSSIGQFNYGTTYDTGSTCYNGCTNTQYMGINQWDPFLVSPYHQANYFDYTSFKITPDITASVQLNMARFSTRTFGGESLGTKTIYADNAYLPQAVQERFVCNGAATGTCAPTLSNGYNPFTETGGTAAQPKQTASIGLDLLNDATAFGSGTTSANSIYSLNNLCSAIGVPCSFQSKVFYRGVFTLNGTLSDDWTWSSYIQWGTNRLVTHANGSPVAQRLTNALDAVLVTSSNVGTSGLPIGSIQCRSLLNPLPTITNGINDVTGCVPVDPFGYQNVSEAAQNWVKPGLNYANSGILDTVFFYNQQVAAEANVNGVLPWKLPAGDIGVATGFDYRLEQTNVGNFDPRSQAGGYGAGNVPAWVGAYNVLEGYLEVAAPLLKDVFLAQDLETDIAGRITSYSTSGLVETWKVGLTNQVNDDWKIRSSLSYDIRAPDTFDLFTAGNIGSGTCARLFPADSSLGTNICFGLTGGNPCLQPEKSFTYTAGIVATPHWIPGLTASVDWYQIHLHGGLVTPSAGTSEQNCIAGILVDGCNNLVFSQPGNTHSMILTTIGIRTNAALVTTAGFDMATNYGFDMSDVSWGEVPGHLNLGFVGNYMYDFSQNLNGQDFNGAGGGGFYGGGAKFKGTFTTDYRLDKWNFGFNVRMTGASQVDLGTESNLPQTPALVYKTVTYTLVNGVNLATIGNGQGGYALYGNQNDVDPKVVPDFHMSYKINDNYTAFVAVDNFLNIPGDSSLRRGYHLVMRWNF